MLLTEKVKVKWNTSNKKRLIENGYNFTKMGDEIEVDISCLTKGSHTIVECTCDDCGEKVEIEYRHYLKNIEKYGKIYCSECSLEHAKDSIRRGKMSISMGQWAIDNNLFHHIDLEKTKAEGIDIFNISYKSGIEIWFKCLKKDYHGSYKAQCRSFVDNKRCPCCAGKEVHPLDSLAQSIINEYGLDFFDKVWNWEKNNELGINPWKITPSSNEKVWWNCLDENKNHEPYLRSCTDSKRYKYRCPDCVIYTGEKEIENILLKYNIEYNMQYSYNDCKCTNPLPFDFYLPDYNILIEYDGLQHYKPVNFGGISNNRALDNFITTKIHDTMKTIYAKDNNIKLIRIPYYDFDNIEEILIKELNLNK